MVLFSVFFALGVWLLQQQAALPPLAGAWVLVPLGLLLLLPRTLPWRVAQWTSLAAFACALGFFHAAFWAQQRLADRLPEAWEGVDITIQGVVSELPRQREGGLVFAFDVEQVQTRGALVPKHVMLSTYDEKQPLRIRAGERWRFTVRLKQPHGAANPYGFDFEAWMLERNQRASGYVRPEGDNVRLSDLVPAPGYWIERLRETVRERFRRVLGDAPYSGVLAALAIGDQGSIPAAQWQVFTRTGVNHLMSISGLHITMFATLALVCTYALWRRVARLALAFPARKGAVIAGLLAAMAYALLSGFSIPAQRTVYMLAVVAVSLLLSRRAAPSQVLAAALIVVLALDPWAVMAPGFWLSFGAVALILYVGANRIGKRNWLAEYTQVQWAMMAGMIPMLLALFQQVSLVSPVANAFAIPLVSFVVAPLAILGAVVPVDGLLWLAHYAMAACMAALEWLNRLPQAVWQQHAPPAWSVALGMAGALWMLLPRGFPARWLGAFMLLPMFVAVPEAPADGTVRLVIFDVGQGLSVAVQTHGHTLLYDAGPDYPGEADSGNRILVPVLHALGIAQLDALMLTHDDTDHTGGALSVIHAMPIGWLSSSLPDDSPIVGQVPYRQRCTDGQYWDWDGVHFEVLHPSRASYSDNAVSKNNRGCTLRISVGDESVLLAADIEKESERRLLRLHPDKLRAALLVAPHHGSKTSSTQAFVSAVHPRYAVFTAGYRNRFGHPKEEVLARYRAAGSELLRSDEDGAVIVDMNKDGLRLERWRKAQARYWW